MALVLSHRGDDAVVLTDMASADLAILDLDHDNAPLAFQAIHARRPALRAIGLTSQPDQTHDDIVVLRKPVSASRLLEAIQKHAGIETPAAKIHAAGAAAALGTRTAGGRRRAEAPAPASQDKRDFDPGTYLLGVMLEAAAQAEGRDAVAAISISADRIILSDSRSRLIRTNLSPSQTRGFALSALEGGADAPATGGLPRPQVEYLTRAEADSRYAARTYALPQESFMWSLGAMTSRGRLLAGIRPDERVYLRRWPNLTRVAHSPNEMRIVAYWVRQPTSLQEIVAALGVTEREVFTVYAAACAAGLAGRARREVDGMWEAPPVRETQARGLFSSILDRLLQRRSASNEATQEAAA